MTSTDLTYCASPACRNECGRKFPVEELRGRTYLVSFAHFCDASGRKLPDEDAFRYKAKETEKEDGDEREAD